MGLEKRCPCYKVYKEDIEFKRVMQLEDAGLVIYRYITTANSESSVSQLENPSHTNYNVFIIHNTKSRNVSKSNYMSEVEQAINCPRCRYIMKYSKELLLNVPFIKKRDVIGICDHCRFNKQINERCNKCHLVVEEFLKKHTHPHIHQDDVDLEVYKSSQKEEEIFLKGIQKQSRSDHNIRHYPSEETLLKSASATTEPKLHKDFSYVFIKDVVRQPSRERISSSELIKDTQDMYRERAEKERIKKEKELKEKLDAEERVRPVKIGRKRRLEEERRLEELKKKKAEHEFEKKKAEDEHWKTNAEKELEKKKPEEELRKKKAEEELKKKKSEEELRKKKAEKELEKKNTEEELRKKKAEEEVRKKKAEKELKKKKEQKEQELNKNQPPKQETKSPKSENTNISIKLKTELKESKIDKSLKSNEEKQRQKEEKERDKANKAEQMRKGKEEKRKEKEEKEEVDQKQEKEERLKAKEERLKEKERLEKKENKNDDQKQGEKEERLKAKEERLKEKERHEKEENKNVSKKSEENLKKKQLEQQIGEQPKDKVSKLGKKQEQEAKKQEAQLKSKSLKETKAELQPEKPRSKKISEESKTKDFNINQVKIRKNSGDDLILQLVKFKKTQRSVKERPSRIPQINILNKALYEHIDHKNKTTDNGIMGLDSDLEFNNENTHLYEMKPEEVDDIIIGTKITKYKPPLVTKKEDKEIKPLFFNSTHAEGDNIIIKTQEAKEEKTKTPIVSAEYVQQEVPKGIIRYALSDRTFIEKGWTMLPTEKVVRKMNVYRMRPAHPEFDWFEHNKSKKLICYDTGEKLAEFDDNGKGRWYYRSGKVALDYYDAEEINAQQRIIIYSSGEPDERGCSRPFAILATFDYLGNGIVFDHSGKIRIKYNQTEGVVLDRGIGPVSHWKWHTLNDPPVLQQVMIDTQMAHKDPEIRKLGRPQDDTPRADNEEMLAIEFDNFIKEKSKKLSQKFKPFQIKMKALKINEYFSLKVLDQATVYLIYRDGSTNLKLNIGMILDHQEIVDTDTAEVGEVSNSLERFPARTDSLAGLQRSVAHAQRVERAWVERTQRLRPAQPCASADRLVAGLSRPKRPAPPGPCTCPCRKPPSFDLYYDTRLI